MSVKLPYQVLNGANIRGSEGAGTTTFTIADQAHQVFNLSAARTAVLPTTGVAAGDEWKLENIGAFDLTVQASGGQALTTANGTNMDGSIQVGCVVVRALQAAPTTAAHWKVVEVYEEGSYTSIWSFISGGSGNSGSVTIRWIRNNKMISLQIPTSGSQATAVSAPQEFQSQTSAPIRIRPTRSTNTFVGLVCVKNGGTGENSPGQLTINTSGVLRLFRTTGGSSAAWSAGSGGFGDQVHDFQLFNYNIG